MLHKAIDVANFFVDMANSDYDDCITNLQVNKLVYFAQAWSLVRLKRALFDDELQAWTYGPVAPSVYSAFRPCGRERIAATSGDYSPDIFDADEIELLLDVYREYGKYSSSELVRMTHEKGTPWEEVYTRYANCKIENDRLFDYYSRQEPLPNYDIPPVSDDEFIGYRDDDGILVLPGEYERRTNKWQMYLILQNIFWKNPEQCQR